MSHLLATVNPEAARRLEEEGGEVTLTPREDAAPPPPAPPAEREVIVPDEPEPIVLPVIGEGVAYYPRTGELRAGKGVHAGIVTAVNPEDSTVDLVVVFDADDFIGIRRVPARQGNEGMGWVMRGNAGVEALVPRVFELEAAVAKLQRQLLGDLSLADNDTILGIIDEHEDRMEALEAKAASAPVPAAVKAARKKAKTKTKAKARAASGPPDNSGA